MNKIMTATTMLAALGLVLTAVGTVIGIQTAFAQGRPEGCEGNPHSGPTRDGGNPHHPPVDEGNPHFCPPIGRD